MADRDSAADRAVCDAPARGAAGDLWRFATRVYADPAVAAACLRAQEAYDLDVNLLLFAAWLADRGILLDDAGARWAAAHGEAWRRDVVLPLRRVRRRWRGAEPHAGAYEALKGLEIEAERHQLETLETLAGATALSGKGVSRGSAREAAPLLREQRLQDNLRAVARAGGAPLEAVAALAEALGAVQSGARNPPD